MAAAHGTGRVFVNDAEEPADFITLRYIGDSYTVEETLGGEVEGGYASGRSRVWSTEEDTTTITLDLEWIPAEERAWLVAHRGRVLCFRDPDGRMIFAAFHSLPQTVQSRGRLRGSITLKSVTFSEAV